MAIERDIAALAMSAANRLYDLNAYQRFLKRYGLAVRTVGRVDGVGKPSEKNGTWEAAGRLVRFQRPAEQPTLASVYRVDWDGSSALEVDLFSNDFDTFLILQSDSGRYVDNDDYRLDIGHSRIEIDPGKADSWKLVVSSLHGHDSGNIALS